MTSMTKITVETIDEATYTKVFEAFIHSSTEYKEMALMMKPIVDGFNGRPIQLMSIGAGNGYFEGNLIRNFGMKVDYFYALEPSKEHRDGLLQEASNWKFKYEIDPENFSENFVSEKRFDLVLMSHCLYCMSDPVGAVLTAKSLLKSNGKVVIFHQADEGGYKLNNYFLKLAQLSSPPINNHTISSSQINEGLANIAADYELKYGPSLLEVSDFIEKRATSKANSVVTFLLQTKYEDLPQNIQNDVYEVVKEGSKVDENGRHMFKHPTAMIVVK